MRRDYLDEIISASSLDYSNCKKQFERVLKQRNILLRQSNIKNNEYFSNTLDIWDEQFAKYNNLLVKLRKELILELEPYIHEEFIRITNINKSIKIKYISSVQENVLEELKDHRSEDIARKTTTIGAHRDDIEILFGDLNSRKQLSQGQQRSLAISLMLAKHKIITDISQNTPIVLLDDALSELDEYTSANLLEQIENYQSIITSATKSSKKMLIAKEVSVYNGVCIYD